MIEMVPSGPSAYDLFKAFAGETFFGECGLNSNRLLPNNTELNKKILFIAFLYRLSENGFVSCLFLVVDSLTIALQQPVKYRLLQEYAFIKNDAKQNPAEKFQRDVKN